ncbi:MAG: bifunctional UDP-N-acetylglucosamine diphosphorylase/glucosamine-1-phosphate N-acetyltransferase GlmU [Candidatus Nanopelagicales bacterium]
MNADSTDSDIRPGLVVVLAAGAGTRMKSDVAKVLHPILGRPLLGHVLTAVMATNPRHVVVVVGHQREQVVDYLHRDFPGVLTAVQDQQNGTGHAVRCALDALAADGVSLGDEPVMVVAGDTPLLTPETLADLVQTHVDTHASVTVLTADLADAFGYGRIVRDADGAVLAIVEQKDATEEQRQIKEINSGMFAFNPDTLVDALARLTTDNSQGEEYLTDVLAIARSDGRAVSAHKAEDPDEMHGINNRAQLAAATALLRDRINNEHMLAGVTIVDPSSAWIEPGAVLAADAVIERNTAVDARSSVGSGAVIGPDTTLIATQVCAGARVLRSHCDGAVIDADATVGPFTFLRPGTQLGERGKVGAFVEVKKSTIGADSKVPHLSYVGDATIGEGSNIGAATIFANYDGERKHPTVVGDHVRVGSDSILVAPVVIGDGAYTAAGSVITQDVPAGAIGIGRERQVNVEGWVARKRPGTSSADATASSESTD